MSSSPVKTVFLVIWSDRSRIRDIWITLHLYSFNDVVALFRSYALPSGFYLTWDGVKWSHDSSIWEGWYIIESHSWGLWYARKQSGDSWRPSHFIHSLLTVLFSLSCTGSPVKMPLIPVVPENHSHVLAEFDCLDPLLSALRLDSGRLKVCFAITCLELVL